jgi:hypothetical protein
METERSFLLPRVFPLVRDCGRKQPVAEGEVGGGERAGGRAIRPKPDHSGSERPPPPRLCSAVQGLRREALASPAGLGVRGCRVGGRCALRVSLHWGPAPGGGRQEVKASP